MSIEDDLPRRHWICEYGHHLTARKMPLTCEVPVHEGTRDEYVIDGWEWPHRCWADIYSETVDAEIVDDLRAEVERLQAAVGQQTESARKWQNRDRNARRKLARVRAEVERLTAENKRLRFLVVDWFEIINDDGTVHCHHAADVSCDRNDHVRVPNPGLNPEGVDQ